jgi:hypothetical protein
VSYLLATKRSMKYPTVAAAEPRDDRTLPENRIRSGKFAAELTIS